MAFQISAFTSVPIREDLRKNRERGDVILDADGEAHLLKSTARPKNIFLDFLFNSRVCSFFTGVLSRTLSERRLGAI